MGLFETRKVQLTGGTSLTVSLPKAWADRVGLRTGDTVVFQTVDGSALQLRPANGTTALRPVRERVDASGLTPRMVEQRVIGLYVAGCDVIEVGSLSKEALQATLALPRRLSGLEAVQQGADWVVFRDLMDGRDFDATVAFDRMYAVASAIHRSVHAALARQASPPLAEARMRSEEVERLQWVAVRQQRRLADAPSRVHLPSHAALTYATASALVQTFALYGVRLAEATQGLPCSAAGRAACAPVVEAGVAALQICDEAARALGKADLQTADHALRRLNGFDALFTSARGRVALDAARGGACGLCLQAGGVLEWVNTTALTGGRIADLAVQHAIDLKRLELSQKTELK